ncbi:MAG: VCBS repeat-containing protein [Anaerolineales bacterium]|nr:VCBS repeat-containing protein [Anaerolineales bacterium]
MKTRAALIGALLLAALGVLPPAPAQTAPEAPAALGAPVLKWQRGGCFSSWCQTGWYASPAVADLDNDGQPEVIWGSYDLTVLNGADGSLQWRASNGSRVWPGVAVADLTGDGSLEVIVGRSGDQVTVYTAAGGVLWTRNPFGGGEVRTLAVADLDGDGPLEIIVGRASGGSTRQLNVFNANGDVRAGWPARRDGEAGYGWGMYNENVAVADLDGNGTQEIIGPTDTHYITALDRFGNQLAAHSRYGAGKVWSQVGVHVDDAVDLRGYANCGSEHRPNFANSAPAIGDLDGDGVPEIVVPGDVYNCAVGDDIYGDLYIMPWILKRDRTRWAAGGFDWTVLPTPGPNTRPLSEDYNVIESNVQNAVLADLDGDGRREILFPAYDGQLHAYWLDKTEHGCWPYEVNQAGEGFLRFGSEPAVVDLDNDGQAEVLFTTWTQKGSQTAGQLVIANSVGQARFSVTLPRSSGDWDGALGAPTVANIDTDPELEVVVGTAHMGVVAYDLPGSAGARPLWATGRGTYLRAGTPPAVAAPPTPAPVTLPPSPNRLYLPALGRGC